MRWQLYKLKGFCLNHIREMKGRITHRPFLLTDVRRYANKPIMSPEETNKYIYDKIMKQIPFMVCRFGGTEMNMLLNQLKSKHFPYQNKRRDALERLCIYSGFFPADMSMIERFVDLYLTDCKEIDLCGIWNLPMEEYVLTTYAKEYNVTLLGWLQPWYYYLDKNVKPWTSALAGKKVLVIHPFIKSIRQQYENNRERIFERIRPAEDILPKFTLLTVKAVQTLNYNREGIEYADWFEALDDMLEQCKKIDFDVAIIGCGAYGFPLAAAIKRMGKGAIHLGGATQLLFGIIGKRWEAEECKMDRIMNECWVRPLKEEQIEGMEKIEGACYW